MVLFLPMMKLKINPISGISMAQKILIDLENSGYPPGKTGMSHLLMGFTDLLWEQVD